MKLLAFALIAVSIVYFAVAQIKFEKQEKVLDIGPITATKTSQESIPFSPLFAGALLVSGTGLLIVHTMKQR